MDKFPPIVKKAYVLQEENIFSPVSLLDFHSSVLIWTHRKIGRRQQ